MERRVDPAGQSHVHEEMGVRLRPPNNGLLNTSLFRDSVFFTYRLERRPTPPLRIFTTLGEVRFTPPLRELVEKPLVGKHRLQREGRFRANPRPPSLKAPPYPPCQGSKPTEEGGFARRCVSRQWLMQTLVHHSRLNPDKGLLKKSVFVRAVLGGYASVILPAVQAATKPHPEQARKRRIEGWEAAPGVREGILRYAAFGGYSG